GRAAGRAGPGAAAVEQRMAPPRVLVLVLAGGAGGRLELLTEHRAKPAVPFGGVYRLIDFPLSNCQHSGIADVWVSVQQHPASLALHLANGRPWDLDRSSGGMLTLPPHQGGDREGWHSGTADSLWRNTALVREHDPAALVVVSADAVYRLDYRDVVEEHLGSGAEVTMVTTEVPPEDASRYGVVQLGDDGRVAEYAYKPEDPVGSTVATEVFVLTPGAVLDRLDALADEVGEEGLQDLGNRLLPDLARDGVARSRPMPGYWRDVGTVEAYWQAHQDFLAEDPPLHLDDPAWPVHTREGADAAARVLRSAEVGDSLLSGGTRVAGAVHGSVLSPNVVVEAGATVVDSVLLPGAVVRAGAVVRRAVVDDRVVVGERATVGGDGPLTLAGRAVEVPAGAVVEAGARYPDPDDDAAG
ncbi:MAG: Glucose-1-phosphate adenylyltransferase, partial [uncultured Quadrisphaera sp.]